MAFNPFMQAQPYGAFSPYGYPAPTVPQQPVQPQPLPQQQVLQANGKASIDALRLAPNSSVLVMDATAPIVWLCVSDSIGTVTAKPYDISEHKDTAPVPADDVADLRERIAAVEKRIEEVLRHEPDARHSEHIETVERGN